MSRLRARSVSAGRASAAAPSTHAPPRRPAPEQLAEGRCTRRAWRLDRQRAAVNVAAARPESHDLEDRRSPRSVISSTLLDERPRHCPVPVRPTRRGSHHGRSAFAGGNPWPRVRNLPTNNSNRRRTSGPRPPPPPAQRRTLLGISLPANTVPRLESTRAFLIFTSTVPPPFATPFVSVARSMANPRDGREKRGEVAVFSMLVLPSPVIDCLAPNSASAATQPTAVRRPTRARRAVV